jgi:hypothetical protein
LAPAYQVWREEVRRRRPDLHSGFNPWDRITTPEAVRKLFQDAGIGNLEVATENGVQRLLGPDDFWTVAMGSGLRWTIEQMGTSTADEVRRAVEHWIAENSMERVETNVVYAVADRV